LVAGISEEQRRAWAYRSAADWAMESFAAARDHAYRMLPGVRTDGVYSRPPSYVDTATRDIAMRLVKQGQGSRYCLTGCWRPPEGWGIDPSRVGR
jgi:hypothetical protein